MEKNKIAIRAYMNLQCKQITGNFLPVCVCRKRRALLRQNLVWVSTFVKCPLKIFNSGGEFVDIPLTQPLVFLSVFHCFQCMVLAICCHSKRQKIKPVLVMRSIPLQMLFHQINIHCNPHSCLDLSGSGTNQALCSAILRFALLLNFLLTSLRSLQATQQGPGSRSHYDVGHTSSSDVTHPSEKLAINTARARVCVCYQLKCKDWQHVRATAVC